MVRIVVRVRDDDDADDDDDEDIYSDDDDYDNDDDDLFLIVLGLEQELLANPGTSCMLPGKTHLLCTKTRRPKASASSADDAFDDDGEVIEFLQVFLAEAVVLDEVNDVTRCSVGLAAADITGHGWARGHQGFLQNHARVVAGDICGETVLAM